MKGPSRSVGGPFLALLVIALVGGGGIAITLAANGKLNEFLPDIFASAGGDMDLGPSFPRNSAQNAAGTTTPVATEDPVLAEMPALVETDSATIGLDSWPDLGPDDLLAQALAIPDRALKDGGFDLPPWRRYARPFTAQADQPALSILVTGLGLDRAVTASAIAGLPAEVSLSFSAYAPNLAGWIAAARAFGHEALIDLPLEGKDFPARDPGPKGLLIGLNESEIARRIDAIADSGEQSLGFVGDRGEALLLDDTTTASVLHEIYRLGRSFIETDDEPMSRAAPNAAAVDLPFVRATERLDENPSAAAISARLATIAQIAEEPRPIVAVTRAIPAAILAIAAWERRENGASLLLAPASAMLNR